MGTQRSESPKESDSEWEKERKARTLLLMAIPKDHLRRFHGMDDAKEIWAAIKTRFGGNANSKKMQKAVLKQQFARECKFKGSKEGSRQEAGRGQDFKPVRTEKEALMTIDEGQINWVEQTTDEELNHALMAFTMNNEDHPLKHMENRGIFDSGCSGHMTGNRAHLEDYQELSNLYNLLHQ
ncbi:hypothetical protein Tco_0158293 [Tanacetum coccineum]